MSRTELRLGLPAGSWLGDVSRSVPSGTIRVTETVAAADGTVATVVLAGVDRDRIADAIRDHDRVDDVRTVARRADGRTVRVAGRPPAYLPAAREVGLPVEATVAVADGSATVTAVGDRDRVGAFGRRLADDDVTVGVAATGADGSDRPLTDAQRELVFEAVAAGYYDTPRECTLTELAEVRGIAKSTCSETLHRAEGRVMRRFVDGAGPFGSTPSVGDAATVDAPGSEVAPLDAGEFDDERDREEPASSAATEP